MVRFGILGFGLHAVKRVMPALERVKHCKVSALSRRSLADAKASASKYRIPYACDTSEALCASPEVDAVFVSTPDACHLADVLTALRHGKPVLCEKPMAMNAREAQQMLEEAAKKNILLGVAHVFRFEDSVLRVRQLVDEGVIGQPLFARSEFCYLGKTHTRQWLRNPDMSCGGPIGDVGVHCLDALRFILRDEVDSVFTAATYDDPGSTLETSASMNLKFSNGVLGSVNVSILSPYRTPFEIVGDQGSIRAHDFFSVEAPVELTIETQGKVHRETHSNHDAYVLQFDAFALAMEKGAPFPAPGEEGLTNQRVLDAAFRSAKSRKAEKLG